MNRALDELSNLCDKILDDKYKLYKENIQLQQENKQLKERIDIASDNLKRNYWINEHEHNDDVVNLTLEILKGDSNE